MLWCAIRDPKARPYFQFALNPSPNCHSSPSESIQLRATHTGTQLMQQTNKHNNYYVTEHICVMKHICFRDFMICPKLQKCSLLLSKLHFCSFLNECTYFTLKYSICPRYSWTNEANTYSLLQRWSQQLHKAGLRGKRQFWRHWFRLSYFLLLICLQMHIGGFSHSEFHFGRTRL